MTRQQKKEERQTRLLRSFLKRGGMEAWAWGHPNKAPDMRLYFSNGTQIGMEIARASFGDKTRTLKFEAYRNWQQADQLGDFHWTELTAEEVLNVLIDSIKAKVSDLPQWEGQYDGRWLALNLDIDVPSGGFQCWNTDWNASPKNIPFWNRMLIELQNRTNCAFDAIIFCTEHWACCINQQINGIPPLNKNIQELAEAYGTQWRETRIAHLKRKVPNMIDDSHAIGHKNVTLIKLIRPQPCIQSESRNTTI